MITGRTTLSSSEGQEIDFDTYFVPAFVSATDVIRFTTRPKTKTSTS